jgi:hypothetical protein
VQIATPLITFIGARMAMSRAVALDAEKAPLLGGMSIVMVKIIAGSHCVRNSIHPER